MAMGGVNETREATTASPTTDAAILHTPIPTISPIPVPPSITSEKIANTLVADGLPLPPLHSEGITDPQPNIANTTLIVDLSRTAQIVERLRIVLFENQAMLTVQCLGPETTISAAAHKKLLNIVETLKALTTN